MKNITSSIQDAAVRRYLLLSTPYGACSGNQYLAECNKEETAMKETADTVKRAYDKLSDDEKRKFLRSLDQMGGLESYTVGAQIDEFLSEE